MNVPTRLTIETLTRAYDEGTLTPQQVVAGIIERARQHSASNIWIVPPTHELVDPYVEQLSQLDRTDRERYPLWGIPFAIKDNIDLAGTPTTAGCPTYAYVPERNAAVVTRLIDAGAIPVGKTNLDQFATGLVGTRSPYGECSNALRPELISGGSSSGSAVSVALGIAAFALGTDTAGSGRVPAALNNLVGFKPPLGSWSTRGVVPACASLDCVTTFAHTLDDACAVDAVANAFDSECAWSKQYNPEVRTEQLPAVVYVPAEEPRFYGQFAESYRTRWHATVERLRAATADAGIRLEPLDTTRFSQIASILYNGAWVAERWSDLGTFVDAHPYDIFPVTQTILKSGDRADLTAADAFEAFHTIAEARQWAASLLQNAVLVMPTAGGTFTRDEVRADPIATNSLMGLYTNHCNLCDLVALAVPTNQEPTDLPFGITLFSTSTNQGMLTATAKAL